MKPIAKASLIALLLSVGATAVAAQSYAPQPLGARAPSDTATQVIYKKKYKSNHKKWVYNKKYGKRYRHKRHGYVYFHDGWWYPRPYWTEPGISIHLGL